MAKGNRSGTGVDAIVGLLRPHPPHRPVKKGETFMQLPTSKTLFGILVVGLVVLFGSSSDAMAQGRGRRVSHWDKKCEKFVNCHDARDGRWDGRGPDRRSGFTNIFGRNRRYRDRDYDRISRRRDRNWDRDRFRDRNWQHNRWRHRR